MRTPSTIALVLVAILAGTAEEAAGGPVRSPPPSARFEAAGLTRPERSSGVAVRVTFDDAPYRMIFALPWRAGLVTENDVQCLNGYAETFDRENCEGCCEICSDAESRYARMWIGHQSPARIVVRTRGALCDKDYRIAHTDVESGSPYGKGDWVDEWYTIYPDGTHVRTVTIYTGLAASAQSHWGRKGHPFECQETIVMAGDRPPTDDIDTRALTLIRMDGQSRVVSYRPYPQSGELFEGANIQVVNLRARWRPFTIVPDDDVAISPYYGPAIDREHLEERVFVGWPRGPKWGRHYCVALTHVVDWKMHERTRNTITRVFLLGMTDATTEDAKAKALVPLARSWLRAPGIEVAGSGYTSARFDRKEKAYVIRRDPKAARASLALDIAASPDSPLVNPAFVIRGWGMHPAWVEVDSACVREGRGFRQGHEQTEAGTDLVVWLKMESTKPVKIRMRPGRRVGR